jgi:hypothetical protein
MHKYNYNQNKKNELKSIKIKGNDLYYRGNKVNPIYYGTSDIPWNIFLTFHYRKDSYREYNNIDLRRKYFETLFRGIARNVNGLSNSSIVYLGVGEYKYKSMHTHILINVKDEHLYLVKRIQEEINNRIDKDIVVLSPRKKKVLDFPLNIQEVVSPSDALAYIMKPEWFAMDNSEKEIFHTDMHGDIESSGNRFIARCQYHTNKKHPVFPN